MGTEVILTQWDEQYAPPDQDVLRVSMVGSQVFLEVCEYDEGHEVTKITRKNGVAVSVHALMSAIATCVAAAADRDRQAPSTKAETI